jgi:cobalt-zinc-cadmium efflux system membrane fusion protein
MKNKSSLITLAIIAIGLLLGYMVLRMNKSASSDEHDHAQHGEHEEMERGPHRGRMLRDGNFALELSIFETGVPPQFRAYLFDHEKPVPVEGVA